MYLLGLHGPAQSGKDTAFAVIEQVAAEAGYSAVRRGFADKLKQSAMRMFKPDATVEEAIAWCDEMKFHGRVVAEILPPLVPDEDNPRRYPDMRRVSGRELLQNFGTEAHRDVFGSDFWVDALLPPGNPEYPAASWHRWKGNFTVDGPSLADIAVITDVRFPNECDRIHMLGGQVWRINRVDLERINSHASEATLPDELIDREVENGYGVDVYRNLVAELTKRYIIPELPRK